MTAGHRFSEVVALLGDRARRYPTGYATDALWPEIHYMPEDMEIDIHRQDVTYLQLRPRSRVVPRPVRGRARRPAQPAWLAG